MVNVAAKVGPARRHARLEPADTLINVSYPSKEARLGE
jgi:hypothetical protein